MTKKENMGGFIGYHEIDHSQVNADAFETRELPGLLDVTNKKEVFTQAWDEIIEQDFRIKLDRAEREKVIAAIKAKQASLDQGVKNQMGIEHEGQAQNTKQIQQEVRQAAQEAPPTITHGPIRTLLVWILKKLPDRVYKLSSAAVILSLALSACSAINRTDIDPGQINPITTKAPEVPATGGQEMPAEVVPELSPVEAALAKYEAGENLDISNLTQEEFVEFSAKLAEQKNEKRGINPIVYNNEAYIIPDNYMMMNYDGHPDMNETIEMFVPMVGKDERGNLQFENKGEIVTIPGSAEMDWNMRVTDPHDPRIDWPKTKVYDDGTTDIEFAMNYGLESGFPMVFAPMILLDKNLGQIYWGGEQSFMQSTFRFLLIETDEVGNPILARKILVSGAPNFQLYREGTDFQTTSIVSEFQNQDPFPEDIAENWVYYIGSLTNQVEIYEGMRTSRNGYQGIVDLQESHPVMAGEKKNDKDMIILATHFLLQKTAK